jgi:hypothetical protein
LEDLAAPLHEEIERLPERYREPVVLCDLQGLTHEKAARHLGWPIGTVKSRLARARELLRERLSRRGTGLPAGLLIAEKAPRGACRAVEVVPPGTLVESTIRAAARFAARKPLAVEEISTRVVILIEEVLKTMFLTKLKLAAVVVLIGAAGAAGLLAQSGSGSAGSPAANKPQGQAAAEPRTAPAADAARVPGYITQSRAMIITRLEEEVAEARARLGRTLRKVRSPEDPAVVHARKTVEDLQQRLDKIDRVLVDVVDAYPTMFDFSGGPSDFAAGSQPAADPVLRKTEGAGYRPGVEFSDQDELARAKDRAEWAKLMFQKGYVSKPQLDAELENYKAERARSKASQPKRSQQQGGQPSAKAGLQRGQNDQSPDRWQEGQGQPDDQQQGKSQGQGKPDDQQQGKSQGQGQKNNPKDQQSPDSVKADQRQQADQQQEQSPDRGQQIPGQPEQANGKSPQGGQG